MKDLKSFSAVLKHEMGEMGHEAEAEEGHPQLKGHPSIAKIAKKHGVSVEKIISQIKKGYKLEKEHTNDTDIAIDIAIQHVNEFPNYYDRLIKMEKSMKSKVKSESVEDARKMLSGKKYCPLCRKFETKDECSYGPHIWNKFSIATVHPTNEELIKSQSNLRESNDSQELLTFTKFSEIAENCRINESSPAWQRKEGKNQEGGLNEKGRKSYEKEHPGSDLKPPQPEGGSRRDSFCARMKGMKRKLTSKKTANDPNSRINKSLRAWNC